MAKSPVYQGTEEFDERQVVELAQRGDRGALSALYEYYSPRVYRYVAARLTSIEDAEDVTTEIFLRVIDKLHSFRWKGVPFGAWLFRIAHNEVVSFVRRQKTRPGIVNMGDDIPDVIGDSDHAEAVERQSDLEEIRKAAERLPEAQRQVISLRFGAGLSVAETAQALAKTENTVKVLQHKAVARLRQWVRKEQ